MSKSHTTPFSAPSQPLSGAFQAPTFGTDDALYTGVNIQGDRFGNQLQATFLERVALVDRVPSAIYNPPLEQ